MMVKPTPSHVLTANYQAKKSEFSLILVPSLNQSVFSGLLPVLTQVSEYEDVPLAQKYLKKITSSPYFKHLRKISCVTYTWTKSGYYCMLFHRRTSHVIELQESGNATYMEEDACHSRHFKKDVSPFTTLITDTPMLQKCPNMGRRYSITGGLESENVLASVNGQTGSGHRYSITGGLESENVLASVNGQTGNTIISTVTDSSRCQDRDSHMLMSVGCQKPETMEIHSECSTEKYSEFNCHGDWLENRTRYVITSPVSRKSGDASRLCFVLYNSADEGAGLQVATVKETCHRNVTMLGSDNTYYSMFNMTAHGE
ncbi:uncharacterized protein LOC103509729 [Diaphorina citri]|uniref:Uncharacterized protein LOC103509729 n=1 Tax=Diaphorina citri TaxID=121845 RepID=A0A3Q0IU63_DIACI|nr:uncharacterized protein LOC103509729 [Diaphorina citri]